MSVAPSRPRAQVWGWLSGCCRLLVIAREKLYPVQCTLLVFPRRRPAAAAPAAPGPAAPGPAVPAAAAAAPPAAVVGSKAVARW